MRIQVRAAGALDQHCVTLAFEASRDCIKMISSDGTLLLLNTGGAETMGFESPTVPVGKNWIDFWHGDEREVARKAVATAANGHQAKFRGYLPTAAGIPKWWESTLMLLGSPHGEPSRLLVISRDVTTEVEAERTRRLLDRRYRTLVEATSQIVWSIDAATGVCEGRGWTEFAGGTLDTADREGWLTAIHPDEREHVSLSAEAARRLGRAHNLEYRLLSRAGEWRWVEDRAVPIEDDDGSPLGWVGVITDVHERRIAEQYLRDESTKLRLALDSASLVTWDVDLRTGECRLSPEARRMLGLTQEHPDQGLLEVIHPDDRATVIARQSVNLRQKTGMSLTTFRIVRPDTGETRWIAARGRAALDGNDNAIRRVGTLEDCTERKRTKEALRSTLRRHQALLDAVSVIVWHSDVDQSWCEREGWAEFTGQASEEAGDRWLVAVHPDDRARVATRRAQGCKVGQPYSGEYRLAHADGVYRWVRENVVPLFTDDGTVEGWVGVIADVHERWTAEAALRASEERLRLASEVTGLGTYDVNLITGKRDWSPEFHDLLRLSRSVVPDRRLFLAAVHPEDRARVEEEWTTMAGPDGARYTMSFRLQFGSEDRWIEARERVFHDAGGRPTRCVGTMQDVTERKRVEHRLWTAAHADDLTGLANRGLFGTRLEAAVAEADAGKFEVCVLLVDVDNFKVINDTLGHDAGDVVLREVAQTLARCCPRHATVARLGGDEFGVLLPATGNAAAPDILADEILRAMREPLTHDGREVECSVSIGWSSYPRHDPDASALLKNADMALYAAKRAGRDRAAFFHAGMRNDLQHRVHVLRRARDAIARDAIFPYYQPKISLRTGRVVGFEALLRWRDASGLRQPSALQEAFSDPELCCRLGLSMLRSVVEDMRVWNEAGVPFGHVALNAGAPELHRPGFADQILGALANARLRAEHLEIEVTEGVLLDEDTAAVSKALRTLHDAGVPVSLDDFGTGYASLVHLKRFPVSWLKIDRSFVSSMEQDEDARVIVKTVVALAHNLGMKTVAEGVESQSQLDILAGIGCDLAQGYLMAKPMAAASLPQFLSDWSMPGERVERDK